MLLVRRTRKERNKGARMLVIGEENQKGERNRGAIYIACEGESERREINRGARMFVIGEGEPEKR